MAIPVQSEEMKALILVVLLLALGFVWYGFKAERDWHNAHYAFRFSHHNETNE